MSFIPLFVDYGMEEQPFEVHLIKGPQGLGMSLTGGEMGGSGRLNLVNIYRANVP